VSVARGTLLGFVAIAAALAVALRVAGGLPQWLVGSPHRTSLQLSGNIEAHESVLSFKTVQSRIVDLPFDEGQWVTRGTLIARLDDADYAQQLAITEAALVAQQRQLAAAMQTLEASRKTVISDEAELAQRKMDLSRIQAVWKSGFETTAARDQASTAVKVAAAALDRDRALAGVAERNIELAQANVHNAEEARTLAAIIREYTTLLAPFDGVILVRQAELGEVVLPGTPVVTLADLDHVWLRAYVNEPDIGKIRHGEAATVTTDTYPGKRYRGRISFISSQAEFTPKSVETHAERITLVYRIRIDIDNPTHELVPGMPADARIELLPGGTP
jgi:HlyD family secretion protein